jgi:mono/diheme cytochrome c family protein
MYHSFKPINSFCRQKKAATPPVVLCQNLVGKKGYQFWSELKTRMARHPVLLGFFFLTSFVSLANAQNQAEGKGLYATYCAACHGEKGRGDGMAAKALPVKPTDHTNGAVMSQLSDKFLTDVITKGGSAVGKSSFMPAWGGSLNDKQIRDVVAYIRTIATPAKKPETPAKK